MSRINWKTYDYSEGPPRSSSSSNSMTHPYVTTSSFIKTRPAYHSVTFSSSDDLSKNTNTTKPKTATNKSLTKLSGADADEFLQNKRSLSYRPANLNPSPARAAIVSDDDDDDSDPREDLPFDVQKNTATNTIKNNTTTQDSHLNQEGQSLRNQNHAINRSKVHPIRYSSFSNMMEEKHEPSKPAIIEHDTAKENTLTNDQKPDDIDEGVVSETESFEDEWQKAEEEWKLAEELEQQKQQAHSKLEQEQPQEHDTGKDDIIVAKQVYPIQQQTQKLSAEVPSLQNRSNNNSDNEYYEFDSFAGDRSIATIGNCTAASSLIGTHLLPDYSSACPSIVSEVDSNISSHVAGVPINLLPPSILRTNGRFDTIAGALEEGKQSVEYNDLTTSKKKHPWEANSNNVAPSKELLDKIQKVVDVAISNVDAAGNNKSPTKSSHGDGESQTSSRKKSHRRRSKDSSDKSDDDSIEDKSPRKSANSLQDRTKQAWSVRNKAAAAASSSKPRSNDLEKGTSISFEKNTIHEFIPDSESEGDDVDDVSFDEDSETLLSDDDTRTVDTANSWYTKSAASEAEDLIKDILLIGEGDYTDPGKRHRDYEKLKKKRRMQAKGNTSGTTQSERDSQIDKEIADSMVLKELQSDPLSIIFDAVESGVTMLSSSICNAYYSISSFKPSLLADESETLDGSGSILEESGGNNDESFVAVPESVPSFQDYDDVTNITDEFTVDETETRALALSTAKLHHKSKRLKYDETSQLNYPKEFRLINVILGLPIGLILADGEACCAISEVLPHGNAKKVTANDPLLKGDSLVSINGISTYNKKVGQICQLLSVQPNTQSIRMTFMRYIGPLRSTNGLDELQGFEVSKPPVPEPVSSKTTNSKKFLQSHDLNTVNDKQVSKATSSPAVFSKKISFKLSKSNNLKTIDDNKVPAPMKVTKNISQTSVKDVVVQSKSNESKSSESGKKKGKTSDKDVVVQSKSNESKSSESGKKKGKLSRLFKRGKKKETES